MIEFLFHDLILKLCQNKFEKFVSGTSEMNALKLKFKQYLKHPRKIGRKITTVS